MIEQTGNVKRVYDGLSSFPIKL